MHIQVTIPSGQPDKIRELATQLLAAEDTEPWVHDLLEDVYSTELVPGTFEAFEFLKDLQNGNYFFKWGNEGDIVLWGMVGNHTEPLDFVERLLPFWRRLFDLADQIVTHDWHHVLVLYTHEAAEPSSGVIEVGWPSDDAIGTELKVTHRGDAEFTCL